MECKEGVQLCLHSDNTSEGRTDGNQKNRSKKDVFLESTYDANKQAMVICCFPPCLVCGQTREKDPFFARKRHRYSAVIRFDTLV